MDQIRSDQTEQNDHKIKCRWRANQGRTSRGILAGFDDSPNITSCYSVISRLMGVTRTSKLCREDSSFLSINLTDSKFTRVSSCFIVHWKTLHKLFSDALKWLRKRAVRIWIWWLTGKKPKYFWDSSAICLEPINTCVTTKSCGTSFPYLKIVHPMASSWYKLEPLMHKYNTVPCYSQTHITQCLLADWSGIGPNP